MVLVVVVAVFDVYMVGRLSLFCADIVKRNRSGVQCPSGLQLDFGTGVSMCPTNACRWFFGVFGGSFLGDFPVVVMVVGRLGLPVRTACVSSDTPYRRVIMPTPETACCHVLRRHSLQKPLLPAVKHQGFPYPKGCNYPAPAVKPMRLI